MPDIAKNVSEVKPVKFDLRWGTGSANALELLGFMDDIDVSQIRAVYLPLKIGNVGDVVLDELFQRLEGELRTKVRQVTGAVVRKLCPWASATGAFSLSPLTQFYSKYDAGRPLNLHNRDLPLATTADDINFVRAFPNWSFGTYNQQTDTFEELNVGWTIFPDRAALTGPNPTLPYWYRGPLPT